MITVYHLASSRSERIVWLMEELGLDYELERFQREQSGAAPEAMKAIHALGRAPVIRDGDTVLAESGAIVEYIVHRYGLLAPLALLGTTAMVAAASRSRQAPRPIRATSTGCISPREASCRCC